MEGWLQVPPERNIMGRGGWKVRYVVFGRDASARASPISASKSTAATDRYSYSSSILDPNDTSPLPNPNDVRSSFFLSVYKQKHDTEPVSRHSIQDIGSCYIGDLGIKQKKQVILPTLIVHLRTSEIQPNSPRSFRRRSHDTPYSTRSAQSALLFRPGTDGTSDALQKWAKEIQFWLNSISPTPTQNRNGPTSPLDSTFPETPNTASSLFFVNGEPSTALLSPSLRSKCSDLSSIASDRRSVSSSSLSELPSPRLEDQGEGHIRGSLHIATNSEDFDMQQMGDRTNSILSHHKKDVRKTPRRETILDRYFSSVPLAPTGTSITNSIARFEALVSEMEPQDRDRRRVESIGPSSVLGDVDTPKKIPSATLRALEFISTGIQYPEDSPSSSQSSLIIPTIKERRSSSIYSQRSRRNSTASLGGHSAAASSFGGGSYREGSYVGSLSGTGGQLTHASASKRHSISDFSLSRPAPGVFALSRPGSISDFTHDLSDERTIAKLAATQNFHSRNNKPLFNREFSF